MSSNLSRSDLNHSEVKRVLTHRHLNLWDASDDGTRESWYRAASQRRMHAPATIDRGSRTACFPRLVEPQDDLIDEALVIEPETQPLQTTTEMPVKAATRWNTIFSMMRSVFHAERLKG